MSEEKQISEIDLTGFIIGLLMGILLGAGVGAFIRNQQWEKAAIVRDVGEYAHKTGEFHWTVKKACSE